MERKIGPSQHISARSSRAAALRGPVPNRWPRASGTPRPMPDRFFPDYGLYLLRCGVRPYEKLQRALKAEVDEAAWAELYSTKSRLFDRPETGKIAVKVINHYGDEVLKVFGV